jgi:hypothetical protein
MAIDRPTTERAVFQLEAVPEFLLDGLQAPCAFGNDFRADAITGEYRNLRLHRAASRSKASIAP